MTPEEKMLLERTAKLAQENNDLLHKLNRRAKLGTAIKVLYWTVIIGLSFGAFYFIQPYLDFLSGVGGSSPGSGNSSSSFSQELQDLLK